MRRLFATLAAVGMLAGSAFAADKTAAEIVKEIEGLKNPVVDRSKINDKAWVDAYIAEMKTVQEKRAALVADLMKVDPENEKLAKLLPQRWQALMQTGPEGAKTIAKEADAVRAKTKDEKLKGDASFFKAYSALIAAKTGEEALPAVEGFAKDAPKDARVPSLLNMVAENMSDEKKTLELQKRILKDFPDSQAAKGVKGAMKQAESVGKPFELEFTDAIKGSEVSMKGLKGKVVVVDFWATWCGPCVAEMPKMKDLYAKYKDQGVEFIGVSLDQPKEKGGLDALKKFVAEKEIGWPQYYQGNFWQSEFSSSWGINGIPCVFIVDAEGNLHSVKARGKLDTMIPELLAKKKAGKS